MADADARAMARQHTAQLLKMLRGYGPTAEPEPALEPPAAAPPPVAVAEATPAYIRLLDAVPTPPPLSVASSPPSLPPRPRDGLGSIPTVGEVLRHPPGVLGQLMARASQLNRLSQIFRAYLPPHLHDHAVLVRLDAEGWEVQTDSASWATRLRYALPTIRQALGQQLGIALPKPRIRVVPAAAPVPTPASPPDVDPAQRRGAGNRRPHADRPATGRGATPAGGAWSSRAGVQTLKNAIRNR